jgi:hypothetical protein
LLFLETPLPPDPLKVRFKQRHIFVLTKRPAGGSFGLTMTQVNQPQRFSNLATNSVGEKPGVAT